MATVATRNAEYAVTVCNEISKTQNKYANKMICKEKTTKNVNNINRNLRRRTRLSNAEIKRGMVRGQGPYKY